jgi:hypothetical protein
MARGLKTFAAVFMLQDVYTVLCAYAASGFVNRGTVYVQLATDRLEQQQQI